MCAEMKTSKHLKNPQANNFRHKRAVSTEAALFVLDDARTDEVF
jgi:hypothetical protein